MRPEADSGAGYRQCSRVPIKGDIQLWRDHAFVRPEADPGAPNQNVPSGPVYGSGVPLPFQSELSR